MLQREITQEINVLAAIYARKNSIFHKKYIIKSSVFVKELLLFWIMAAEMNRFLKIYWAIWILFHLMKYKI